MSEVINNELPNTNSGVAEQPQSQPQEAQPKRKRKPVRIALSKTVPAMGKPLTDISVLNREGVKLNFQHNPDLSNYSMLSAAWIPVSKTGEVISVERFYRNVYLAATDNRYYVVVVTSATNADSEQQPQEEMSIPLLVAICQSAPVKDDHIYNPYLLDDSTFEFSVRDNNNGTEISWTCAGWHRIVMTDEVTDFQRLDRNVYIAETETGIYVIQVVM